MTSDASISPAAAAVLAPPCRSSGVRPAPLAVGAAVGGVFVCGYAACTDVSAGPFTLIAVVIFLLPLVVTLLLWLASRSAADSGAPSFGWTLLLLGVAGATLWPSCSWNLESTNGDRTASPLMRMPGVVFFAGLWLLAVTAAVWSRLRGSASGLGGAKLSLVAGFLVCVLAGWASSNALATPRLLEGIRPDEAPVPLPASATDIVVERGMRGSYEIVFGADPAEALHWAETLRLSGGGEQLPLRSARYLDPVAEADIHRVYDHLLGSDDAADQRFYGRLWRQNPTILFKTESYGDGHHAVMLDPATGRVLLRGRTIGHAADGSRG